MNIAPVQHSFVSPVLLAYTEEKASLVAPNPLKKKAEKRDWSSKFFFAMTTIHFIGAGLCLLAGNIFWAAMLFGSVAVEKLIQEHLRNFASWQTMLTEQGRQMGNLQVESYKFRENNTLYGKLNEEHKTLNTEYDGLNKEHKTLIVEHAGLNTKYDGLNVKHETLNEKHESLLVNHAELNTDYDGLNKEHKTLIVNHAELNTDYDGLNKEHKTLIVEHAELNTDYDGLNKEHKTLIVDHAGLNVKHESLLVEHAELNTEYDDLNKEHKTLIVKHGALNNAYGDLNQTHSALLEKAERDQQIFSEKVAELKANNRDFTEQLYKFKIITKGTLDDLTGATKDIQNVQLRFTKEFTDLREQQVAANEELENTMAEIARVSEELAEITSRLADTEEKIGEQVARLGEKQEQLEREQAVLKAMQGLLMQQQGTTAQILQKNGVESPGEIARAIFSAVRARAMEAQESRVS